MRNALFSEVLIKQRIHCLIKLSRLKLEAASASAIGGLIPGGSLGVEILLTGVTVAMVIKLDGLFDRSISDTVAHDILTVVSGMVAGKLALNAILTWIPGVASVAAATVSFTFHETAGWIVYEGFENGDW